MIKKLFKLLHITLLLFFIFTSFGCADIGDWGGSASHSIIKEHDYEEYYRALYESFSFVDSIYALKVDDDVSNKVESKSFKDFFSKETVNNLSTPIPTKGYFLIVISVSKDIYLDSISMYVKGSANVDASITFYMFVMSSYQKPDSNLFSSIYVPNAYTSDVYKKKGDDYEYDTYGNRVLKDYYIPKKEEALSSKTVSLKGESFTSFTMDQFLSDDVLYIKENSFIVLEIYDNTGFATAESINGKPNIIEFTFTNILARSDKAKYDKTHGSTNE